MCSDARLESNPNSFISYLRDHGKFQPLDGTMLLKVQESTQSTSVNASLLFRKIWGLFEPSGVPRNRNSGFFLCCVCVCLCDYFVLSRGYDACVGEREGGIREGCNRKTV